MPVPNDAAHVGRELCCQFVLPEIISLADDPVLVVAYSASLRSANVPAPGGPDDDSAVAPRHYLDTAALRKQLSAVDEAARSPASSDARARAIHRRTAEIPVFLFALDMDHPVFVDNTDHTAMAVGDMVIGVQSSAGIVPTGLACGGQRVASDVGRPAKALVAATIEQLSGLLPPHVSAPVLGSDVEEDWLWATASGAMGALSPESDVYEVHRDAVRRAAMIHEIEDAVAAANEAYDTLDALPRDSTHAFAPGEYAHGTRTATDCGEAALLAEAALAAHDTQSRAPALLNATGQPACVYLASWRGMMNQKISPEQLDAAARLYRNGNGDGSRSNARSKEARFGRLLCAERPSDHTASKSSGTQSKTRLGEQLWLKR